MKAQILSDLNLKEGDVWDASTVSAKAPVMVLLGNIAPISLYQTIIESLSWFFEHILIVPGVLEYSSVSSLEELSDKLSTITTHYPNAKVLIRDSITIQGVNIIGLPLWCNTIAKDASTLPYIPPIPYLTPKENKKMAKEDVSWLSTNLSQFPSSVVFTHFPPMESKKPNAFWVHHADVEHMVSNPPVTIWSHLGNCKDGCTYNVAHSQIIIPPLGKDAVVEILLNNGNNANNANNSSSNNNSQNNTSNHTNEDNQDVETNGNGDYDTSEKTKQETDDIIQKLLSKKVSGEEEEDVANEEQKGTTTKKRYFEQTQSQSQPQPTPSSTPFTPTHDTKIEYTDEDELESFLKSSNHPPFPSSSSNQPSKEKKKKTSFKF